MSNRRSVFIPRQDSCQPLISTCSPLFLLRTVLCLILLPGLCSTSCKSSSRRTIAVIPKGQAHVFWQAVHAGAQAAGNQYGVEILWNGPATEIEISRQITIVEDFISRRVDGLVVAPADQKALVPVIENAARQGIPVTLFDPGAQTEAYVSYVATDNYAGGVKAAHRLGDILGKKGSVAVVATMPGSASTTLRENGFKDTLAKEYPDLKIIAFQYGMSDRIKSRDVTEDLLTAHPDLNGLFCSNESGTVGASQAVKGRRLAGKVKIVGFDSSPNLISDLQEGSVDSLVVQNPFAMGYEGVKSICEKLQGKTPQRRVDTGVALIHRENLGDTSVQQMIHPDLKKYLEPTAGQ